MAEEPGSGTAAEEQPEEGTATGGQGMTGPSEDTGAGSATPPISDQDQDEGETQRPAPGDDAGVPDEPEKG